VVAVDVDGTILSEKDGSLLPGAREALERLRATGWRIVIWTHRVNLDEVKADLKRHRIPYDHINEDPETDANGFSRKVYFDATVDDKAVPFDGDWAAAIGALERKRAGWRSAGETKVRIMEARSESPLAVFSLRDGVAVEETGTTSKAVLGMIEGGIENEEGQVVRPGDGEMFLKALSAMRGTYLWAEAR
jgi:hypothetical protein